MAGSKHVPPEAKAAEHKPREIVTTFDDTASDLAELDLYDELGDDADAVRDVLMAVTRIAKLEEGRK